MLRSLCIAVAMYSKLPVPRVDWDQKSLSWAMCFFPVVGVVISLLLGGWLGLCAFLGFGPFLRGAGALLLPIAVSGASTWTASATPPTPWAPTRAGRRSWRF